VSGLVVGGGVVVIDSVGGAGDGWRWGQGLC